MFLSTANFFHDPQLLSKFNSMFINPTTFSSQLYVCVGNSRGHFICELINSFSGSFIVTG